MFVFYLRLLVLLLNPPPPSYLYLFPLPTTTLNHLNPTHSTSSYLLTFLPLGLFSILAKERDFFLWFGCILFRCLLPASHFV